MDTTESSQERLHSGLYEAHLPVTNVDRSVTFYAETLDFEVGFGKRSDPSVLLVYSDGLKRWMLGLFEVQAVSHRHPAEYHVSFRTDPADVDQLIPSLRRRGVTPVHPPTAPAQGPMTEPIVHGWMPAASVFFRDPDGHLLELIADLPEAPRPDVSYCPLSEWRALEPH